MGKKKIADLSQQETETKEEKNTRVPGLKGGQRVVEMTGVEIPPMTEVKEKEPEIKKDLPAKAAKPPRKRGKAYKEAKAKIDPSKSYPLDEAVGLMIKTSISAFPGSAEVHLVVIEPGLTGEVELPHFTAKEKRIATVSDELIEKIKSGKIDFDILLASPAEMPKIVPFAKILGPKGLMPNPKNGTLVDDPQKAIKSFRKSSISFKTEKAAPLIHFVFGKINQKEEELVANLKAFLAATGIKKISKATICSSMGPAIKIDLSSL